MPDPSAPRARLVQLLTPAVEATGHDLEDVTVSPAGRRKIVRVVVDSDSGVTLDDIAAVSRVVSDVLDEAEQNEPQLLSGAYVLEVTSPGVDRPLTQPRHWRRSTRRLVKAKLGDGSVLTGRVLSSDETQVVLDVDGVQRTLLLAEVASATVQVEFTKEGTS